MTLTNKEKKQIKPATIVIQNLNNRSKDEAEKKANELNSYVFDVYSINYEGGGRQNFKFYGYGIAK